jgi:hypothetical protein
MKADVPGDGPASRKSLIAFAVAEAVAIISFVIYRLLG